MPNAARLVTELSLKFTCGARQTSDAEISLKFTRGARQTSDAELSLKFTCTVGRTVGEQRDKAM